jgi:protein-tyrosine phosphatase
MSLKMLDMSINKGVNRIVFTPHCYSLSSKDINKFIEQREKSLNEFKKAAEEKKIILPDFVSGCEVHLSFDISKMRAVEKLCIENTKYILLEMPSSPWNDAVIDSVYNLSLLGITPIIAHDERNLIQKEEIRNALYNLDVLIQVNASSFGNPRMKKYIDSMFRKGMLHIIGSDMHNCDSRPNQMDKAKKYILKRYGSECFDYLMNNARIVLSGQELSYRNLKSFRKKSIFGK